MARQILIDLAHRFASGVQIVALLDRSISEGTVLVLFGPSGAGKTTILRALGGLLRPDRGRIVFEDTLWLDSRAGCFMPPQQRRVGYVAQEPALFPHLTVRSNVEYGLHGVTRLERGQRAEDLTRLVGIGELESRLPRQLSGGQAQRVALARALAPAPPLLLLDEPFGALDAVTRRELRRDVRTVIRKMGASAILVTHDRAEAMAMGDELAVMVDGAIRQIGPMPEVFQRPADPTVARSLGVETVRAAKVAGVEEGLVTLLLDGAALVAVAETPFRTGEEVFACIRAEDVLLEQRPAGRESARNHLSGVIAAIEHEGAIDRVTIECGFPLVAAITRRSREELALGPGSPVTAAIKATAVHVVPKM